MGIIAENFIYLQPNSYIINQHFVYCREAICGLDIKYYVVNGCLL